MPNAPLANFADIVRKALPDRLENGKTIRQLCDAVGGTSKSVKASLMVLLVQDEDVIAYPWFGAPGAIYALRSNRTVLKQNVAREICARLLRLGHQRP